MHSMNRSFLLLSTLFVYSSLFSMKEETKFLTPVELSKPAHSEEIRKITAEQYKGDLYKQNRFFERISPENITYNKSIINTFFRNGFEFVKDDNLFSTIFDLNENILELKDAVLLAKICLKSYFDYNPERKKIKAANIATALKVKIESQLCNNFFRPKKKEDNPKDIQDALKLQLLDSAQKDDIVFFTASEWEENSVVLREKLNNELK